MPIIENENTVLLHVCCAPCGAYSLEFLKNLGYNVTLYFYNPNIYPLEEYQKRLNELKDFADKNKIPLITEKADFQHWAEITKGLEFEPEKGKRCFVCYKMRLQKTAQKAEKLGFAYFTTTLSISPHKSYEMICEISKELEKQYKTCYLDVNLKKKDGYKKSIELSKMYGFYRQNYCGCKFSVRL